MKDRLFSYQNQNTLVHRLSGIAKLFIFLLLTFVVMLTYDLRIILMIGTFGLLALKVAKIKWNSIKFMVLYLSIFILMNSVFTFIFSPLEGVEIYGSYTPIFTFVEPYVLTLEELFYLFSKMLKYAAVVPLGMVFLLTTHPSEFASALNRIGVPYKIAYSFALTLRYFPDVFRDYNQISLASQARGLDISKNEKVLTRIKNVSTILFPLIFSTLERIEVVSNAMDLRGFGKHSKRTWYSAKQLSKEDKLWMGVAILLVVISLIITFVFNGGSRFYNPFI